MIGRQRHYVRRGHRAKLRRSKRLDLCGSQALNIRTIQCDHLLGGQGGYLTGGQSPRAWCAEYDVSLAGIEGDVLVRRNQHSYHLSGREADHLVGRHGRYLIGYQRLQLRRAQCSNIFGVQSGHLHRAQ